MKWSLFIGKISGIKIFVHWTFIILVFWVVFSGIRGGNSISEILLSLGFIITVFACITLHEFGHALTAKRFNFKTRDITLLPIGGLARMEGLPHKPKQEFLVAIMGPAVNIVIGALILAALKITDKFPENIAVLDIRGANFWYNLYTVNVFLALFNLIPAFPMDGGRILRALLSTRFPRVKATRIAAYTGQFIAILFVFIGLWYNPMLILIGLFVFIGAKAEVAMEETKSLLGDTRVGEILMHNYSALKPTDPLWTAVSLILEGQDRAFLVKDENEIKGTLSKTDIIEGLSKFGRDVPVDKVMQIKFVKLDEQDKIDDVILKFSDEKYTLMPVYRGKELVGVLNLENIQEYILFLKALNDPRVS